MKTVASVIALSLLSTGVFCQQKAQKKETKAQTHKTAKTAPRLKAKMRSNMHSKPTQRTKAQTSKSAK